MPSSLRVLIVEDVPDDAELMILLLTEAGFQPDWQRVETEDEYLSAFETPPDLILSDWNLPYFNGQRALQLLTERGLNIPFIIVSGSIGEEIAIDALRSGADDYVLKDRPARLGQAVKRALEDNQLREERKRTEEALRESEAHFRIALQNSPIVVFIQNRELRYTWIYNPHSGFDPQTVLGKTDAELLPAGDAASLTEIKRRVLETGVTAREEIRTTIGGQAFFYDLTVEPLRDTSGNITGVTCASMDITERKQAEQAIKASEERYRAFVQNSSEAIWCLELNQTLPATLPLEEQVDWLYEHALVVECNEAMAAMHNYKSREEMLDLRLGNLLPRLSPDNHKLVKDFIRNGYQISERESIELSRDVEIRYFVSSLTGILEDSALWRIWGVKRDITMRKQVEEEIRQLNAELEQRIEERTRQLREAQDQLISQERLTVLGQLAGGVAHEMHNPLTVIKNIVYYLNLVQPEADDKVREYHAMIEHEVNQGVKIVTDLLDFTRSEMVDREPAAIPELVQHALKRTPPPPSVSVMLDLPSDLPRVYVDLLQIEQALGNLVANACQAMPQGGQLTFSARQEEQMIAISVKDAGVGISPENMKRLFEPLFTTKAKGMGMGLAISKKLVEANSGRIEVESEAGNGSTFNVVLPIHQGKTIP